MVFVFLLLACFVVMLASLAGVFFLTHPLSRWTNKNLKYLISFSAGVFIFVSFHLSEEAIDLSPHASFGIAMIILGAVVVHIFSKLWPEYHHHHEHGGHAHTQAGAKRILFSDAIHNIGDGIVLALAFSVDVSLGIATTISVFIHEAAQEVSEFFVLKEAGLSTKSALTQNFLTSSTIFIGAIVGYFLTTSELLIGPLLGFSAGALLYILIIDLIPKSLGDAVQKKMYLKHLVWALVGVALILSINNVLPHTESDGNQTGEVDTATGEEV